MAIVRYAVTYKMKINPVGAIMHRLKQREGLQPQHGYRKHQELRLLILLSLISALAFRFFPFPVS